jgi:hypothetical protein
MKIVHPASLHRRKVLVTIVWSHALCMSLLVFLGGLPFTGQWWLSGGFPVLPEAVAATSCEGELPEDADPPPVAIGERLFLETRFRSSSPPTHKETRTPFLLLAIR